MTTQLEAIGLEDLARRVEAADGADRELDALIAVAVEHDLPQPMGDCRASYRMPSSNRDYERIEPGHFWLAQMSGLSLRSAPAFTASLDTAMLLVPQGPGRWPQIEYVSPNPNNALQGHRCRIWMRGQGAERGHSPASAALALTAAALRARAASISKETSNAR